MSFSFSFGGLNTSATKKVLAADMVHDALALDHIQPDEPFYVILLDELYSPVKLKRIEKFVLKNGIRSFKILYSLNVDVKKEEITGGLAKFYRSNQTNWKKYSEGARAIFAVGSALYAINKSADITIDCFRDIIFNKTYFWSPDANTWVFPLDSFLEIFVPVMRKNNVPSNPEFPVDTYKTRFAEYQFSWAQDYDLSPPDIPELKLVDIQTTEEFIEICERYEDDDRYPFLSWDLETNSLSFFGNKIVCFTFSFDGETGYYVPWHLVDKPTLNRLLKKKRQIGANLKFDVKWLWQEGVPFACVYGDTVELGHVINEQRYNGLKPSTYYYTPFGGYDRELDLYKEKTGVEDYSLIPKHICFPYATKDAILAFRVYFAQLSQLRELDERYPNEKDPSWSMERYYNEIMMPAYRVFAEIEYRGVYVNKTELQSSRARILGEVERLEAKLAGLWNITRDFDFNSTHALGRLFESMGWEELGRTKVGLYITDDACLERWKQKGRAGAEELQELRSLKTILKAFISSSEDSEKGWEQYIKYHPEDNSFRMHPNYGVMLTESGRGRCSNPNLQNIPAHGDLAELVKRCITSPNTEDYLLATVDYASLQARIAAIDTSLNNAGRDRTLYGVYTDPKMGADLHSLTAFNVFALGKELDLPVLYEVLDETTGKTYTFNTFDPVKTTKGVKPAYSLKPEDELVFA